ncbi:MAG: carboxypeptidase regulatory-like domain-containing protein [Bacteroidales bacterium]|nr:carboxypeptidase regulatory-like domain-containing protein [Bacteroidales bacterium]
MLFFLSVSLVAQMPSGKTAQEFLQHKGEVYFSFDIPEGEKLVEVFKMISIDNLSGNTVYAYANAREFEQFLALNLPYQVLEHPGDVNVDAYMKTWEELQTKDFTDTWDFYPTYEAYVNLMSSFEEEYPELCEVFNIGSTVMGRSLLFAKISANVSQREAEPRFMYTSTMHGDETTGFVLSLRLIHYLLSNYGTNDAITYLLDNMEIWICPNENPDGTYRSNNNTVSDARRYNANGVDLNRNYPNPVSNPGNTQPETQAMINFVDTMNFTMSANMHGGIELVNYPFDSWTSSNPANRHADQNWWYFVSREYADTAQNYSPSGYMDDMNNGVTHGGDWYVVHGSRQDYLTYYARGREFTLELSNTKLPNGSQLPGFWNYNYRSLLNYMKQALYGIHGTVTDATTGEPLEAMIEVLNHDQRNSEVYSVLPHGNFHRPILAGTYNLKVVAPGYPPLEVSGVTVQNYQTVYLDIQMGGSIYADFTAEPMSIPQGGYVDFTDISLGDITQWEWSFNGGEPAQSVVQNPKNIVFEEAGLHTVSLTVSDGTDTDTRVKNAFIKVLPVAADQNHLMSNATVATCGGNFYDSGGPSGQYGNNQNYTMTFVPATQGDRLKFTFSQFSVEANSSCSYDWLKIYDGPDKSASLIGTYCGNNSPGVVTSTHTTGALTFEFHSDGSVTQDGWAAAISCEPYSRRLYVEIEGEGGFNMAGSPLSGNNPWQFAYGQEVTLSAIDGISAFSAWVVNGQQFDTEAIVLEMTENMLVQLLLQPFEGPLAVFEPETIEFGTVLFNNEVEKSLVIRNTGNETLEVTFDGFTGDAVFSANIPPLTLIEIPANGQETLTMIFFSEEVGNFAGEAVFSTNDPEKPEVIISLSGNAFTDVSVGDLASKGVSARLFPNPIKENSLLELTLTEPGHLSIGLYDLAGAKVGSIFDGVLDAGVSSLELSGFTANLSSGIYLLRITHPKGITTLRVVNIR